MDYTVFGEYLNKRGFNDISLRPLLLFYAICIIMRWADAERVPPERGVMVMTAIVEISLIILIHKMNSSSLFTIQYACIRDFDTFI